MTTFLEVFILEKKRSLKFIQLTLLNTFYMTSFLATTKKTKRKASSQSMQMMENFTTTMGKRVEQVFTTLDNLAKLNRDSKMP